jgi:LmbE family N-acetylglucosaminyl deacetylase
MSDPAEPITGPVLACFAHPDDMEIGAGGTVAKWAAAGREVHLLLLTNGDRGAQDPSLDRDELARTRAGEQEAAAAVLGLAGVRILSNHDGELENTHSIRVDVARVVRELHPAIVLTCDPTAWFFNNRYFNHRDHRQTGEATLDAVFPGAGNALFFGELLAEGLEPWNAPQVYLAWTNEPNLHEDVTGFLDTKLRALAEHKSQLEDDTLAFFEKWLTKEASEAGAKIGVEHAESFRVLDLRD